MPTGRRAYLMTRTVSCCGRSADGAEVVALRARLAGAEADHRLVSAQLLAARAAVTRRAFGMLADRCT